MPEAVCHSVFGLPGSDLTGRAVEYVSRLLYDGVFADQIVVLVRNAARAREFHNRLLQLHPCLVGSVRVMGFVAFVEVAIREQWIQLGQTAPDLPRTLEPVFLAKDLSQFLLSDAIEGCPEHLEKFARCPIQPYQVLDQITSASYIACSSCIPIEEIGERLARAWPDPEQMDAEARLEVLGCCVKRLRAAAKSQDALEYGHQMELFARYILDFEAFWDYRYLVVDQVEDSPQTILQLYTAARKRMEGMFLTFTLGGSAAYTAISATTAQWCKTHGSVEMLPHVPGMADFGLEFARRLQQPIAEFETTPSRDYSQHVHLLEAETYLEATALVVSTVSDLIEKGTSPERIAIITPKVDQALAQTILSSSIGKHLAPLNQFRNFVRIPLVRALLTAAMLAHPDWGYRPNTEQVAGMLAAFLGIDRVRATLLADEVWKATDAGLQPSQTLIAPERITFSALTDYDKLHLWLERYCEGESLPLDHFWGLLHQDLLVQTVADNAELANLRALVDAAKRFRLCLPRMGGSDFLRMLVSGQTPTVFGEVEYAERLILATPLTFVNTGVRTDVQIWFDITAGAWSKGIWQPLMNHRVLTPEWDGSTYSQSKETHYRREQLARTILHLSSRNERDLYLVRSETTLTGEDNFSGLDALLQATAQLQSDLSKEFVRV